MDLHSWMRRLVALHLECFGFESRDSNFLLFVIFNYNFYLKSLFCLPILKCKGMCFFLVFIFIILLSNIIVLLFSFH